MSEVALDTNILLRLANPGAPEHALCLTLGGSRLQ